MGQVIEVTFRLGGGALPDDSALDSFVDRLNDLIDPDAVVSFRHGVAYVTTGVAPSDRPVREVLMLAEKVETIGRVQIADIDDDLVDLPEIAERAHVSHEAARLWAAGRRRRGFPQAVGAATSGDTRMWAWSDVHEWLQANEIDPNAGRVVPFTTIQRAEFRVSRATPAAPSYIKHPSNIVGHVFRVPNAIPIASHFVFLDEHHVEFSAMKRFEITSDTWRISLSPTLRESHPLEKPINEEHAR